MQAAFMVQRAHVAATDWSELRRELAVCTGNEYEAASILRSIVRLGLDASIDHYQITPSMCVRGSPARPTILWSVRAVPR